MEVFMLIVLFIVRYLETIINSIISIITFPIYYIYKLILLDKVFKGRINRDDMEDKLDAWEHAWFLNY